MTSLDRINALRHMTSDELRVIVIEQDAALLAQTHRADRAEAGFRRCMEPDAAVTKAAALNVAQS